MNTVAEELNIQMVIKLLAMTTSMHDGEALNAIRMVNSLLAKHNANWDELMRGKVQVIDVDPFAAVPPPPKPPAKKIPKSPEIDGYFSAIFNRGNLGSFQAYVDDVHKWYQEKGFLTEKQYDVIKRSAFRR